MNINEHTTPEKLERYAFLWSLARMVIAALSLFFGVSPILYDILDSSTATSLLGISYLISGIAAVYLLYTWHKRGQKVFGGTDQKNRIAFLIMGVTGVNLGLAPIINSNIGISLINPLSADLGLLIFKVVAVVYLLVAWHLWTTWRASGEQLFGGSAPSAASVPMAAPENKPMMTEESAPKSPTEESSDE